MFASVRFVHTLSCRQEVSAPFVFGHERNSSSVSAVNVDTKNPTCHCRVINSCCFVWPYIRFLATNVRLLVVFYHDS